MRHDRCSDFKVSTLVPCAHIQWFDDLTIFKVGRNSSEYAGPIRAEKEKREQKRQTLADNEHYNDLLDDSE